MLPNFYQPLPAHRLKLIAGASLALLLAACGGGGGNPGAVSGGGSGGTGGGTTTPATAEPAASMTIVDGNGTNVNSLAGGQSGTVRVKVVDAAGKPAAGAIVTFTGDAGLVSFTQASALTDANGLATTIVKPASMTSAGAVAIGASAAVGGKTATASTNIAVGAAPLTVGALSFNPAPSAKLPAYSTAALSIPITSGGQPASTSTGITMTSLCVGNGTATLVPGTLTNGVLSATYTNNGCLLGTDTITVSIGTSSQSINIGVDAANIGSIQFAGSDLADSSIVLKGSGGLGRKESALLTFTVVDQNNRALAGVDVSFRPTTNTGGLTVQPDKGTTDANGRVTTTVSSGTIPTPVRVIAEAARNGRTISGLSDTLVISTGLPIQRSLSFSADSYNIEGWNIDGSEANLTVRLADQYGNPISDKTAVNFITEGGAVGSSAQGACTTTDGGCSVKLRSQNFRPLNGRVTVLTYVQGVEDFDDLNGDGQFNSGDKPYDMGDPFLDAGSLGATSGVRSGNTLDGVYTPANGDRPVPFNRATYSAAGDGQWGINYIRAQQEFVFSGSQATLVRQVCDANGACRDWNNADGDVGLINGLHGAACSAQTLSFRLHDVNNNPMPKDTAVSTIDVDKVSPGTMFPAAVPSTNAIGGTFHHVTIKPDTACAAGSFTVRVATPGGYVSAYSFKSKSN